jgi:hypothetical protein
VKNIRVITAFLLHDTERPESQNLPLEEESAGVELPPPKMEDIVVLLFEKKERRESRSSSKQSTA